jgi:hypothetical protein
MIGEAYEKMLDFDSAIKHQHKYLGSLKRDYESEIPIPPNARAKLISSIITCNKLNNQFEGIKNGCSLKYTAQP